MRNLKRALSLALATVMTLGLMVVGTGAVGYDDVTSEHNEEAIEVLQAVGIMSGVSDTDFDPDGLVTRNQMAVIMSQLLNLDYDYYRGTNPFTDVPSWAAPYVAACAAEGVTAGIGDGLYGGDQNVTAAQAALMILKALGYFQYQADFDEDWQISTVRQASYIGLFDRIDASAEQALTRNQIAQLVLNGLKSNMVIFTGDVGITVNGVVIGHNSQYTARTNAAQKYNSIDTGTTTILADNGQYFVQLGEELYDGKLKLGNGTDDFERPSRVWSYDGQEIGTYAKNELIVETYTAGVTGKTMYNLLSAATIEEYDLANYVDGREGTIDKPDLVRSNSNDLAGTGDGVVTQVFVDNNAEKIDIISVNTYLAQAAADYSDAKEYAPLNVYVSDANGRNYNVDIEDVANVDEVTEDTYYQVNISYKDNDLLGEVKVIRDVEILTDVTVSKFSAEDNGSGAGLVTKLTTGGEEYKRNVKAFYDDDILNEYDAALLTNATYNVYVDDNNCFLGVDLYEGSKNYVFITGYDLDGSNIAVKTARAAGIFLDGTMKSIDVNVKETNENIADATGHNAAHFQSWTAGHADSELNQWYTYTVDADGNYTLKPAVRMTQTTYGAGNDVIIRTDNLSVVDDLTAGNRVYGEDETVFITVEAGDVSDSTNRGITEVNGVYTGVQEVELELDTSGADALRMGQIFTVYDSDWYVIGAVVIGDAVGADENLAFILTRATSEEKIGDTYYWTFDAILNGEIDTFTAKSKYQSTIQALNPFNVQELRFDGDYVTDIRDLDADDLYTNNTVKIDSESVYQMRGLTRANTTLNLQGRTFYLTANRSDVGLALASDAKAVTIQQENNKDNVKTEFTTVAAAIAHLADPDNNSANGTQYDGDIYAILDGNGVAQWIVFDSANALITGSGIVPPSTSGYTPVVTQRGNFLDIQANTNNGVSPDVYTAAWNWLVDNGYNVVNVTNNGTDYTFIATKGGNTSFFTTNLITMVEITLNGKTTYVQSGTVLSSTNPADVTLVSGGDYWWFSKNANPEFVNLDNGNSNTARGDVQSKNENRYTISYASHNGTLTVITGLYQVYLAGVGNRYYEMGDTLPLTGSQYSTDGTNYSAIPAGGLKMSADLKGATIYSAWKVTVAGESAPEYVANGGTTTTLTKLGASLWYRTDDGKFVQTDAFGELTGVNSDVTISTINAYVKVATPNEQTSANKIGSSAGLYTYTITTTGVKEGSAAVYLKANDTITVSVTYVSGTVTSDTINVTCDATTVSGTGSVNFTSTDPVGTTKTVTVTLTAAATDGNLTIG